MKIAFWSNAKGISGVSSNMAAISVASVIRFPYSIVTFENHLSPNNLGRAYFGASHIEMFHEVENNYYEGDGMEGLIRRIYRGRDHSIPISSYMKEVIYKHLYYIPQKKVIHNEIFNYEFNHCIHPLLHIIENYADISFIDTENHNNLTSKTILEEADLIVVNLCQNPFILKNFFQNYSSLISKSILLIGNYNYHSSISIRKIAKLYEIPAEQIIAIPYNDEFCNAYMNGAIVEYVSVNYSCNKSDSNHPIIQAIKKASYIIIKKAEQIGNLDNKEIIQCGR